MLAVILVSVPIPPPHKPTCRTHTHTQIPACRKSFWIFYFFCSVLIYSPIRQCTPHNQKENPSKTTDTFPLAQLVTSPTNPLECCSQMDRYKDKTRMCQTRRKSYGSLFFPHRSYRGVSFSWQVTLATTTVLSECLKKIETVLTQLAREDTKMCINYVGITFNELHNKTAKTLKTTTKQVRVNFPFSFFK